MTTSRQETDILTPIIFISVIIGIFAIGVPLDLYLLHLGVFCGMIGAAAGLVIGLVGYTVYIRVVGDSR